MKNLEQQIKDWEKTKEISENVDKASTKAEYELRKEKYWRAMQDYFVKYNIKFNLFEKPK